LSEPTNAKLKGRKPKKDTSSSKTSAFSGCLLDNILFNVSNVMLEREINQPPLNRAMSFSRTLNKIIQSIARCLSGGAIFSARIKENYKKNPCEVHDLLSSKKLDQRPPFCCSTKIYMQVWEQNYQTDQNLHKKMKYRKMIKLDMSFCFHEMKA